MDLIFFLLWGWACYLVCLVILALTNRAARRAEQDRLRVWRQERATLWWETPHAPSEGEPLTLDQLRDECADVPDFVPAEFTREGGIR